MFFCTRLLSFARDCFFVGYWNGVRAGPARAICPDQSANSQSQQFAEVVRPAAAAGSGLASGAPLGSLGGYGSQRIRNEGRPNTYAAPTR